MLKPLLYLGIGLLCFGLLHDSEAQSVLGEANCISGYCTEVGVSRDWHVECTRQERGMRWCTAAPWTKRHDDLRSYEIAPLRVEVWQYGGEVQSHVKIEGATSAQAVVLDVDGEDVLGPVSPINDSLGWQHDAALGVIKAFKKGRRASYQADFNGVGKATKQASLMGFTVAWKAITTFLGADPLTSRPTTANRLPEGSKPVAGSN